MLPALLLLWASVAWPAWDKTLRKVSERDWIEISTPNFRVLSTLDSKEASTIALGLERFRAVIARVTNAPLTPSPVPTHIYAFDNTGDFQVFTDSRHIAGWFMERIRNNVVALSSATGKNESSIRTIFHEYVRFQLNHASEIAYPLWYSEGFAEYLSTVAVHGDGMLVLGGVPKDRMGALRSATWIPVRSVISKSGYRGLPPSKIALWHAKSWALVHYLHQGREGSHDISSEVRAYITLVESGVDEDDAFEQAFGESVDTANFKIKMYLTKPGRLEATAVPLSVLNHTPPEPQVRSVELGEISLRLGQLALARDMAPDAQFYFHKAIAEDPSNARAHAGLGDAYKFQYHWDEAAPYFEKAIKLGPDDALNHLDLAEFTHDRALRSADADERKELLEWARIQYVKSQKCDADIPETYAMYGRTYLPEGQEHTKSIAAIEQANRMLPGNESILHSLALAYLRNDRTADAREIIERLLSEFHRGYSEDTVDDVIEKMMKELEFKPAS
jgi:tetratricopeptide (TPR) repeat protein